MSADGGRVTFSQAWRRSIAAVSIGIIPYLGCVVAVIGHRRPLHDELTNTRVTTTKRTVGTTSLDAE